MAEREGWLRERGGCFLEGEPRQGRWEEEPKGATEASSKLPFQAGRRGSSEGDAKERIGVSGLQGAPEAGCYGLCGCAPPPPPTFPPSFQPPPVAPRAVLLPGVGIGGFRAALAQGAVVLRDVLVSGRPGIFVEAREGEEVAARGTEKEQFTEKCSLSPFGDVSEIKGLWVEAPRSRETPLPPGSQPENAQVSRHSRRRELRSAGRQFCGFLMR